MNKPYHCVHCT